MEEAPQPEEWKIIEEPGLNSYFISNYGNVRRLSREFKVKWIDISGSMLKGYRYFQQIMHGKRKNHLIHRCVAKAFIENPDNKPCVDHIDNNQQNNHVSNLRWCYHAENCKNQKPRTAGKKNGVWFCQRRERWVASARENNKNKFLGYYDTYEDAKQAREQFEGQNIFYKKGDLENFSDIKGKAITKNPRGAGSITKRSNGSWRAVLIRNGEKVFDKTFKTQSDAEEYHKVQMRLL